MPKDTRTAALRNKASRELCALLTTIQHLGVPDALDVIREALRRLAEKSRETLLAAELTEMIEARGRDVDAALAERARRM